jgi:arylsulfatase A-like enzyme
VGLLTRRLQATVSFQKLWPNSSSSSPGFYPSASPNEGVTDAYWARTEQADVFRLGSTRVELPALLFPLILLAQLGVWGWDRAKGDREQGAGLAPVVGLTALAALAAPIGATTAGAYEPQAFVIVVFAAAAGLLQRALSKRTSVSRRRLPWHPRFPGPSQGMIGVGILAGSLGVSACNAPPRPNLVLITLDTTRSDHLSLYGYALKTTPNLDRIATEGVWIRQAYAPMPATQPSHSSIFTSLYPMAHGVEENGHVLGSEARTLASVLKERGYQTAAFVSSFVLNRKFGLSRGFDRYDDEWGSRSSGAAFQFDGKRIKGEYERRGDATTERATRWLTQERNRDLPFFLWVHYFDAHDPYDPPEPFRSRYLAGAPIEGRNARYDGEIAFADSQMGVLIQALDAMGLKDNTLLVIVGDHGEGLGQHNHQQHSALVYEEAVRVPFVLRWPSVIPAGRSIEGPVELVDVMPSALGLMGVPTSSLQLQGLDQAAVFKGLSVPDRDRPVLLQREAFYDGAVVDGLAIQGTKLAVRSGRFKYIEARAEGTRELYDLVSDPGELHNLAAEKEQTSTALATLLKDLKRRFARAHSGQTISDEDRERLKALGYVR